MTSEPPSPWSRESWSPEDGLGGDTPADSALTGSAGDEPSALADSSLASAGTAEEDSYPHYPVPDDPAPQAYPSAAGYPASTTSAPAGPSAQPPYPQQQPGYPPQPSGYPPPPAYPSYPEPPYQQQTGYPQQGYANPGYPQGPMVQPGYGSPYGFTPLAPMHRFATPALVCGIIGLVVCPVLMSIVALVLGIVVLRDTSANPTAWRGRGMGVAGTIMGGVGIAFYLLLIIIEVATVGSGY